ncbi:hypothetical protein ASD15_11305 [Massilia sp. Root351]|nr:hypothetical protein ASD15_11305 [Massilia sp. Root351]
MVGCHQPCDWDRQILQQLRLRAQLLLLVDCKWQVLAVLQFLVALAAAKRLPGPLLVLVVQPR